MVAGCSQSNIPQESGQPSIPEVHVASPVLRDVVDDMIETGRTEANESVQLRARVSGYLVKINFTAGAEVKKGQVLFEIDPRPYEAALAQAQGEVKRAESAIKTAAAELSRTEALVKTRAASASDLDKMTGLKGESEGALMMAKAAVENAKLNLEFTKIVSPIDGLASKNELDVGNLVSPNTLLTTIVNADPIFAYFNCDELTVQRVQKEIREGKQPSARESRNVPMQLALPGEVGFPHAGTIDFVDNRVDASTGTLRVRGKFANPPIKGVPMLSPGMFVRVRVPIGMPKKAVVVNERAIATNQGQKFVYIVNAKNEVGVRPVELGRLNGSLREIVSGLKGDEKVVVVGLQRVRPGATVAPKTVDMPTGAAAVAEPAKSEEPTSTK